MVNEITITISAAAATAMLKSLGQSAQKVELDLDRQPNPKRQTQLREEWMALDESISELQEAKRQEWFPDGE